MRIVKTYDWSGGKDRTSQKQIFIMDNGTVLKSWKKLCAYTNREEDVIRAKMSVHGVYSEKVFSTPVKEYKKPSKTKAVKKNVDTSIGNIPELSAFEKSIPTPKASTVPYLHDAVQNRVQFVDMSDRSVAKYRKLLEKFNNRCEEYNTRTAIFLSAHDRVGGCWDAI